VTAEIMVTADGDARHPVLTVRGWCSRSTLLTTQTVVHDHRGNSATTAQSTVYLHQVRVHPVIDGQYREDVAPDGQRVGVMDSGDAGVEMRYALDPGTAVTFVATCPCEKPAYSAPLRAPGPEDYPAEKTA